MKKLQVELTIGKTGKKEHQAQMKSFHEHVIEILA
jgi:hypothetical protein